MQKKVCFITGVSRGIGRALAEKFLSEGYSVIGTSTSGKVDLNHKSLIVLKLDLSSTKSIENFAKNFGKLNKKIDILVNNAGIWSGLEDSSEMRIDLLRKVLEVNLIGTIDFTERLIPFIKDSGKIINVSSSAGSLSHMYYADHPDYSISKAALNMYTRTLSFRLKQRKITVNSIHPGWVETDMGGKGADLKPSQAAQEVYDRIITLTETGQFWFKQDKFPW